MMGSPPTFEVLDSDGNGLIDREEAREETRLYNSFITFDSNGDGAISKREYQRYLGPRTTPPRPFGANVRGDSSPGSVPLLELLDHL